jgi:hypothetical protein
MDIDFGDRFANKQREEAAEGILHLTKTENETKWLLHELYIIVWPDKMSDLQPQSKITSFCTLTRL